MESLPPSATQADLLPVPVFLYQAVGRSTWHNRNAASLATRHGVACRLDALLPGAGRDALARGLVGAFGGTSLVCVVETQWPDQPRVQLCIMPVNGPDSGSLVGGAVDEVMVMILPVATAQAVTTPATPATTATGSAAGGTAFSAAGGGVGEGGAQLSAEARFALLSRVVDALPYAVWWKDSNGVYLGCNQRAATLGGLATVAEIVGKTDAQLAWSAEHAHLAQRHDDDTRQRDVAEISLVRTPARPSHEASWWEAEKIPMHGAAGEVIGLLGVMRDVTTQKRAEDEVIVARQVEATSLMARSIAHDFNNYLSGILGNAELALGLIQDGSDPRDCIRWIRAVAERASGLTRQLEHFALGGPPVTKLVAVGRLVADTAGFVLSDSDVTCDLDMPEDLWSCDVDDKQISQVLHNIILNARQAMNNRGSVHIACGNCAPGAADLPEGLEIGHYVRITIADNGPGIPASHRKTIFEPYVTTRQGGRGLGLAICRSIMAAHHGHIHLDSPATGGTRFDLFLPATPGASPLPPSAQPQRPRGSGRVLVADTSQVVRFTASRIFTQLGFDTETTGGSHDALALYLAAREDGRPFQVVLLDISSHHVDDIMEHFAAMRATDDPTLFLASLASSEGPLTELALSHGFAAVIPKPYGMRELWHALNKWAVLA